MGWPPDETIWTQVQAHLWKWERRSQPIRLILIHSTRGNNTMELQYQATKNWQMSPTNIGERDMQGNPLWGSMSSRIVSHEGQHCVTVPDDYYPTYSAGHMDPIAISFELAQPNNQTPYTEACLERATIETAKLCLKHHIPPVVLPYVSGDNHEAPGIARHDQSANGRKWGKTDPGQLFDDRAFEERVKYHMAKLLTEAEALRFNKAIADVMAADRDLERVAFLLRYIYLSRGWT